MHISVKSQVLGIQLSPSFCLNLQHTLKVVKKKLHHSLWKYINICVVIKGCFCNTHVAMISNHSTCVGLEGL